jgi:hypothetical protein
MKTMKRKARGGLLAPAVQRIRPAGSLEGTRLGYLAANILGPGTLPAEPAPPGTCRQDIGTSR